MSIDPVVLLAEKIHAAETTLRDSFKKRRAIQENDSRHLALQFANLRLLHAQMLRTVPTSAVGASEMIRIVVERQPVCGSCYAAPLREIASRFSNGQRTHDDLVWLRALHGTLTASECSERDRRNLRLLQLAIRGASRPVVVYRSVGESLARERPDTTVLASLEQPTQAAADPAAV